MMHDLLMTKPGSATPVTTKAAETPSRQLWVGAPNDAFEREADRAADAVMAGDQGRLGWSLSHLHVGSSFPIGGALRRKCSCGRSGGATGECEDCKEKKERMLQRQLAGSGGPVTAPAVVHDALRSPGQPLDSATRGFFERHFGHDFGGVRIHTGPHAAESAGAVNALAYTVGREIVFAEGQHAPSTVVGRKLLAHELAHVVQQSEHASPVLRRQKVGDYKMDPCITAPVVGQLCGQKAAEACSKAPSIPGCSLVCKVFDCDKPPKQDLCPPGFKAAGSKEFTGQCCKNGEERPDKCCPRERIAFGPTDGKCCKDDEVVQGGECVPSSKIPPLPTPCIPPGRPTITGKCCLPPLVPGPLGDCEKPLLPVPPPPRPSGPVIINFVLDRPHAGEGLGALNASLTSAGQAGLNNLIAQLKANTTWKVQLVGRASPEGTEPYNMSLSERRAKIIADALGDAGISSSRIADAPGLSLPAGCKPIGAGLKSCGEIGSKGEADRQVAATLFAP